MPEFDSYEDAKEYYDRMVDDRKRYGDFNAEIGRIDKVLQGREVQPGENLKDFLMEERNAYVRVRDNLESKFPERYGVSDIGELNVKIRDSEPELERLRLLSQSYEIEKPGSDEDGGQPPGGVAAVGGDSTHHDRIPSPRSQGSNDFGEIYTKSINEVLQRKKGKDSKDRDDHEM